MTSRHFAVIHPNLVALDRADQSQTWLHSLDVEVAHLPRESARRLGNNGPNDQVAIPARCRDLGHLTIGRPLVRLDPSDRVLVHSCEQSIGTDGRGAGDVRRARRGWLSLSARVGGLEAVESLVVESSYASHRAAARSSRRGRQWFAGRGVVEGMRLDPSVLVASVYDGLAIVSSRDDLRLGGPSERDVGENGASHRDECLGRSTWCRGVNNVDGRIVGYESQSRAGWGEGNVVNPAAIGARELAADGAEGELVTPCRWLGLCVDTLDECRKDICLGVRSASSEEDVVGVPVHSENSRAERLLDVLGYPPVVLLVKRADGDSARTRAYGELVLVRRPLDRGGCAVDTEQDKGWLPAGLCGRPDVGVTVLRTGDDTVRLRSPRDGRDELIVLGQGLGERPAIARFAVDLGLVAVWADCDFCDQSRTKMHELRWREAEKRDGRRRTHGNGQVQTQRQ